VAGTVYEPSIKEVVIGATCTLKDVASAEIFTAQTDNWGDFWFRGLADDRTFELTIEKDGRRITINAIGTKVDMSLGDIALTLHENKE
jgi:hypothetical protein